MSERDIQGNIEVIKETVRAARNRELTKEDEWMLISAGISLVGVALRDLHRAADALELIARRSAVDPLGDI